MRKVFQTLFFPLFISYFFGKQLHKARGFKRAFEDGKLSFNFDRKIAVMYFNVNFEELMQ